MLSKSRKHTSVTKGRRLVEAHQGTSVFHQLSLALTPRGSQEHLLALRLGCSATVNHPHTSTAISCEARVLLLPFFHLAPKSLALQTVSPRAGGGPEEAEALPMHQGHLGEETKQHLGGLGVRCVGSAKNQTPN